MDQADGNSLTAILTKKRSSKVPRDRKYMHRRASRKMHPTNGVNIESRVTRGEIGNSELPELTDLPKKFGYKVTQKISVTNRRIKLV